MRRLLAPRFSWTLAGVAVIAAISGSALAYFTAAGLGIAEAKVSKLTTPTITTASAPAAGGTVSLAWSAATAPGAEAVEYFVTRDGGAAGGTCATEATPGTAVSCSDSGLEPGKYTYTVTAVWRSWTAVSSTSSVTVTIGRATQFAITAVTTTPGASAADNLTITAKDVNGATAASYTGSHSLIFSGASSSPSGSAPSVINSANSVISFGAATALTFTAGITAVASSKNGVLKIYKAGAANVVATETSSSITTTVPLALTVIPGTATKYVLAAATTTPVAGVGDDLTITAQDAYGNTASAYTGSHNLVFSGAVASPGGSLPTVSDPAGNDVAFGTATAIVFSAGVANADDDKNGEMVLYKSATAAAVKATEGTITNTAVSVTPVAAAAAKLVLTAATLTPVAAASDTLTTTAQDAYGNTATSYTGSKSIAFSGATTSPSGAAPNVTNTAGTAVNFGAATVLTFTNGATASRVLKLNKAEVANVTATDGTISTAAPVVFTVSVGAAARWALTSVTASAGSIGSPCLFTCAITSLGNGGTVAANVSVTDSVGNTVSELGSGHTAKVTASGGTVAEGASLAIPATGPAVSTTRFTYTAPASGAFTNTITAAFLAGTAYTTATATPSK